MDVWVMAPFACLDVDRSQGAVLDANEERSPRSKTKAAVSCVSGSGRESTMMLLLRSSLLQPFGWLHEGITQVVPVVAAAVPPQGEGAVAWIVARIARRLLWLQGMPKHRCQSLRTVQDHYGLPVAASETPSDQSTPRE
eukprot:4730992-Lingulodinium_polyedra.AAC.1